MKLLTVVRHGKAESPLRYDDDFDRPLMKRGREDTPVVAQVLARLRTPPNYILSSPAVRADQTAELLAKELDLQDHLYRDRGIYEASGQALLELLRQAPESAEHVLLVGHNPGLEDLVAGLCTSGAGRLNLRLPTAALAYQLLNIRQWQQMQWGCGQLQLLVMPRSLR
jgi:phosphohistidine phosphatase